MTADGDAGLGVLAGIRVAVAESFDDATIAELGSAGAVVTAPGSSDRDVAVTTDLPPEPRGDGVLVVPTAAAIGCRCYVTAPDLDTANRVLTVLASAAAQRWPADVRFAAPDSAVIGVAETVPGAVPTTLSGAGWAVDADHDDLQGVDAVITVGSPTVPADMCAIGVAVDGCILTVLSRAFDDAVALDVAAVLTGRDAVDAVWCLSGAGHVELVVFGAHLRGGPLTHQLTDRGSRWAGEITTAPRYRMTVLPTSPAKPAITRVPDDAPGAALYGHRWLMSAAALGDFLSALPAPMQLGKVEFADGTWRTGFGCDAAAATGPDISAYGSWPAAVEAGAVSFSRRSARPVHDPG